MKKKMLIYAHYYAPDVASTGQILQDQAEGMKDERWASSRRFCARTIYHGHG